MKHLRISRLIFYFIFFVGCKQQKIRSPHLHNEHKVEHNENLEHSHSSTYFDSYTIENIDYGTKTEVKVIGDERIMITNALPNHKTGTFPNQGNPNMIAAQSRTYTLPVKPRYIGKATWVRETGVALNGVKFEPGTAEVVECDSGENYRVEAFQDVIDLGLDFNNAHVQPTGAYHYHGVPTSVLESFDIGQDLIHVGFAHDGFPIYYSKNNLYKSSYKALAGSREGEDCTYENPMQSMDVKVGGHHDGTFTSDFEYVEGAGDLDECNGINIGGNYFYVITNQFPYISRCLMGDVKATAIGLRKGQIKGASQDRPTSVDLMRMMDADNDGKISKDEAKGPLSEQFERIDIDNDGFLSKDEIESGKSL